MNVTTEDSFDEDSLHFILLSILDISAILANLLLITAIIQSTPSVLRNYSVILLFMATVDCNAALMSVLSTTIVENIDGLVVYYHIGPCRLIHEQLCNSALTIHIESIGEACVLMLISFSYRLFSFPSTLSNSKRVDSRFRLLSICLLATIPAVIATVTLMSAAQSLPSLFEHPQLSGKYLQAFNISASPIWSSDNLLTRISFGYIMFLYLTASPILFILRRKLLAKIRSLTDHNGFVQTSSSDKYRHQMILRSLTIQMFLPLSFSISFVFWILDYFEIYRLKTFQRAIMPASSIFTLISPLIILYYLPPYRKFCRRLFSKEVETNVVQSIGSSVVGTNK
ncbi:hypothetical protein PRIPAC_78881 [Pristionchus pacificus]|uniref:G protein-coupled receptor n=1 Tax=Pristionchus pacificus TaxID=54126 RepID=A0A2A6C2B4_PRIPA|nr:hypothetical protein PRIPAC_78881 [Pristionchus pacificus]|eukprot:PDM72237.1 G protein-coupled receptor [Pristionchus pacificus]